MKLGFTYLLYDGVNYKIGMTTRSVSERTKELNGASGIYNKIVPIAYCGNTDCYELEKELHLKYDDQRISQNREWFDLTDEQVDEIIIIFDGLKLGIDNLIPETKPVDEEAVRELAQAKARRARLQQKEDELQAMNNEYTKAKEYSVKYLVAAIVLLIPMYVWDNVPLAHYIGYVGYFLLVLSGSCFLERFNLNKK